MNSFMKAKFKSEQKRSVKEIYFWSILKTEQKNSMNINYFWKISKRWTQYGFEQKLFLTDLKKIPFTILERFQ